jgi:ankyrin repeat protein
MDASQDKTEAAARKLYMATYMFDMEGLAQAIAEGAPVSGLNFQNRGMEMTPLMVAASFSNPEACRALLAAGAKIDEEDLGGRGALGYAAADADPETMMALMGGRAPEEEVALLFSACSAGNRENARFMLSRGVDATARIDGIDAMMISVEAGHVDCAILVLIAGGDPTAVSPEGLTAVEICRESGHDEAADQLASAIHAFQERQEIQSLLARQSAVGRADRKPSL